MTSVHLEYADERDEPHALEGKIVVSRYGSDGSNLSFNLIHERQLGGERGRSTLLSAGYARDVKAFKSVRPGVEFIHSFSDHLGPTASFDLGSFVRVTAGVAFPLNRRNDNSTDLRFNARYEF